MLQPSGIKDTLGAAGFVPGPAANAVIASVAVPAPPTGQVTIYSVEVKSYEGGTPDALLNNMELRVGSRVITKLPSTALALDTNVRRVTVLAGETTITVNATAIGTGTYIATLQATQVA